MFNSLVMTSCHFELIEEYVSVAKVTVGPPLSWFIPKLFRNVKPLQNNESWQIVNIYRIYKIFLHISNN